MNHTTLHINCSAEAKKKWLISARSRNMNFEEWVNQTLTAANVDTSVKKCKDANTYPQTRT